ncbi:MAG: 2TM domain-containing protein [Flavobacterium sp.]
MEPNYTEGGRYYQAQEKVKEIRKFYEHLTVYVLCNPIVIIVNLMTSPGYLYFWYSLLGWGVAIILHGLKAFDRFPFFNKEWEKRKIDEILEKENNQQKWE